MGNEGDGHIVLIEPEETAVGHEEIAWRLTHVGEWIAIVIVFIVTSNNG